MIRYSTLPLEHSCDGNGLSSFRAPSEMVILGARSDHRRKAFSWGGNGVTGILRLCWRYQPSGCPTARPICFGDGVPC